MRRLLPAMIFLFLCYVTSATAEVTGPWAVTSTFTTTVKMKRMKPVKQTAVETGTFVFNADHSVEDGYGGIGTWSQKKKNFTVEFDLLDLAEKLETMVAAGGEDVIIDISSASLKGKEDKNGFTASGALKCSVYFVDYDVEAVLTQKVKHVGQRAVAASMASVAGDGVAPSVPLAVAVRTLLREARISAER